MLQVEQLVPTLNLKAIAMLSNVIHNEASLYSSTDRKTIYQMLADRITEINGKRKIPATQ
jgi:hypothetical protein